MVHLKRSLLLLAAILAIQFLQPADLLAADRGAKARPKAKTGLSGKSASKPKAKPTSKAKTKPKQKPKTKPRAGLSARSAMVMNMTTGEILFSKNPDEPIAPASLTKILTLYLIYEALDEGRVRRSDIVHVGTGVSQVDGSRMRIRPGTQIALEDLMKGMAIMSANDASVAAAEYVGGDVDGFVRQMNLKAGELGMTSSQFKNPSGLREEGQVTTARDILRLSCGYINRFPQSLKMHSLPVFEYGRRIRNNTNHLLETNPSVDGLKTGHVEGSGYHIVVTARENGTRIVAVVLGSKSSGARFRDARDLIEEGFRKVRPSATEKRMAGAPAMRPGL